jgi:hypothetical protein
MIPELSPHPIPVHDSFLDEQLVEMTQKFKLYIGGAEHVGGVT